MSSVIQTLLDIKLTLLSHGNCWITDVPEHPRVTDLGWTTDFTKELAQIDSAIESLTGELHKCPECGLQSNRLLNVPTSSHSKCGVGHSCNRTASGDCS